MKGNQTPTLQDEALYRPKTMIQLFDGLIVNDTVVRISDGIECGAFRKFGLYLKLLSTSTPTTLQIKVEFLDRWSGQWCQYKQGPFASLFYEDSDLTSVIGECFTGDVLGRALRVTMVSVGGTSTKYFTVSVGVDFWN